jgi:hypothetical protein
VIGIGAEIDAYSRAAGRSANAVAFDLVSVASALALSALARLATGARVPAGATVVVISWEIDTVAGAWRQVCGAVTRARGATAALRTGITTSATVVRMGTEIETFSCATRRGADSVTLSLVT